MLEFEKCVRLRFEGRVYSNIELVICYDHRERRRSTESSPPRNVVTVHTTVHPCFQISVASSARSTAGGTGALKCRKMRLVALSRDEIRRKTEEGKGERKAKET